MKSTSSAAQISKIFRDIRQANFSGSITHGPRINAGRLPPMVTDPIFSDLDFTKERMNQESRKKRKRITLLFPAFLRSRLVFPLPDRQSQTAHRARGKRATQLRASPRDKAAASQRGNSKWKTLPVYAAGIRNYYRSARRRRA